MRIDLPEDLEEGTTYYILRWVEDGRWVSKVLPKPEGPGGFMALAMILGQISGPRRLLELSVLQAED